MKIKTEVTMEIEKEVQVPYFSKHNKFDWYYAVYTEDESDAFGGIIVRDKSIENVYPKTALTPDTTQITEQEFNEAAERVLHKIQSIFYQTVNQ